MENATKALLIAAAVLIAILIISLGIVVYNMASETIGSVNFSDQEITAFNDKFTQYDGEHMRGSEVNAMLKTVLDSNMKSQADGLTAPKTTEVTEAAKTGADAKFVQVTNDVTLAMDATSIGKKANTARLYTITTSRNPKTGFINSIKVTEEKS